MCGLVAEDQTSTQAGSWGSPDGTGTIQGVITLRDIDVVTAGSIQGVRTKLELNMNSLPVSALKDQLQDLLGTMLGFIEKYFPRVESKERSPQISSYVVTIDRRPYDFYALVDELNYANDKEVVRLIASNCFNIYDHFAKQIGIEIATTRINPKKKS